MPDKKGKERENKLQALCKRQTANTPTPTTKEGERKNHDALVNSRG